MAMTPTPSSEIQHCGKSPTSPLSESVTSLRTVHIDSNSSVLSECSPRSSSKLIAGYALQGRLGVGSFASVYKGVRIAANTTGETSAEPEAAEGNKILPVDVVAIKSISRSEKLSKKILANLEIEISLLARICHPNIVRLYQVQKTQTHYNLILEYCGGGDLQRLIRSRKSGRLSEKLTRRLFRDLTAGLKCLYDRQLIHRDIKPQNLLLTGPLPLDEVEDECKETADEVERQKEDFPSHMFALKLADFGFARHLQTTSLAETLCGSPLYMAPEILQHQRYDASADLWSAGAVLFEMVAGRPPFHGENHIDLLRNIQRRAVRLPPGVQISTECINLLRILLNRNPTRRATFDQFLEASHEFIKLGCNGSTPILIEPVTCTQSHSLGNIRQSMQATPHLHKISEESPLSESIPGDNCPDHDSQKNLQLAKHSSFTTFSSRNSLQVTADHERILTSNAAKVFSTNTVSPFEQTNFLVPGSLPLAKNPNQAVSHLSPLVASPPGAQVYSDSPLPPFSLDGDSSNHPRTSISETTPSQPHQIVDQLSNLKTTLIKNEPRRDKIHNVLHFPCVPNPSSQCVGCDGDEFVMVEQMQASSLISYEKNSQPQEMRRISFSSSARREVDGKGKDSQMQPNPYRRFCGLLSTSPVTGGKLLSTITHQSLAKPQAVIECDSSGGLEVTVKTLSAAEDVGRRAVNVAHLGDTRAYLAMRYLMEASISSSVSSFPIDCVEDLDAPLISRARRNSFYSKAASSPSIKEEIGDDDDDDEMPFAVATVASDDSGSTIGNRENVSNAGRNSTMQQSYHGVALVHFREALSCYLKALPLIRGAVNAVQRVFEAVESGRSVDGSKLSSSFKADDMLTKRCQLSLQWLAAQFNGVLERAESAAAEVQKLNIQLAKQGKSQEFSIVKVEELIYNHSLACGRDGAVKQLLGHYEAARSCYRSAGLLAETLLMEPRLSITDKQILEGYVNGFSDRIREVDRIVQLGVDVNIQGVVSGVHQHDQSQQISLKRRT